MGSDSDKKQFYPFVVLGAVVAGIATAVCSVTKIFRVGSESAEFAAKEGVLRGFIDQTSEVLRCIESKEKVTEEIARRREKLENLKIEYNSISHLKKNKQENLMCRITYEKEAIQHLEQIEQNWDSVITYEEDSKYYLEEKEKTSKVRKGKREQLQENADECVRKKQEVEREIQELEVKYIEESKRIEEMERLELDNEKRISCRVKIIKLFFLLFVCVLCYIAYYFGVF